MTGQGYGLDIGGRKRLCPVATGHSLVTPISLTVSVKDQPLERSLCKSYREHTLGYGALGRLIALLLWVSGLFGPTDLRRGWWRSLHRTKSGTQERRLGVQVWTIT